MVFSFLFSDENEWAVCPKVWQDLYRGEDRKYSTVETFNEWMKDEFS